MDKFLVLKQKVTFKVSFYRLNVHNCLLVLHATYCHRYECRRCGTGLSLTTGR